MKPPWTADRPQTASAASQATDWLYSSGRVPLKLSWAHEYALQGLSNDPILHLPTTSPLTCTDTAVVYWQLPHNIPLACYSRPIHFGSALEADSAQTVVARGLANDTVVPTKTQTRVDEYILDAPVDHHPLDGRRLLSVPQDQWSLGIQASPWNLSQCNFEATIIIIISTLWSITAIYWQL